MGNIVRNPGVPPTRQVIAGTNCTGGGALTGDVTINSSGGGGGGSYSFLHVNDTKAANNDAGGFTAGAWTTRTLNTTGINTITGASLAANQITLPDGTYLVLARAPAYRVGLHQIKLANITDGVDALIGSNALTATGASTDAETDSIILSQPLIVTGGPKVFELQHRCAISRGINGLGALTNWTVNCIYAAVFITKIA